MSKTTKGRPYALLVGNRKYVKVRVEGINLHIVSIYFVSLKSLPWLSLKFLEVEGRGQVELLAQIKPHSDLVGMVSQERAEGM